MKYRLKDRELQKKLDDISNGDFSVCLNNVYSKIIDIYELKNIKAKRILSVQIDFGEKAGLSMPPERCADKRFSVNLLCSEIEQIKEYNPEAWNEFPEVEPPEGVLMRVELNDGGKTCALFHHFSDGDFWCSPSGSCWPKGYSDRVILFRPWLNDDEIEAK